MAARRSRYRFEIARFSSSASSEPSNMWLLKSGGCPRATRASLISISGSRNGFRFFGWQWSVCSAISTSWRSARRWAASAITRAPSAMSRTAGPVAWAPPPLETCTIPSLRASAKPSSTAFSVSRPETLMPGYAKRPPFALSSMAQYCSNVAIGMAGPPSHAGCASARCCSASARISAR